MRNLRAAMAMVLLAASSATAFDFMGSVGIVDIDAGGRACMDIANPRLRVGQRLTVVTLTAPQAAVAAEVTAPHARPCRGEANARADDAHYVLRLAPGPADATVALAVLAPGSAFSAMRGLLSADLDGDGRRAYFRSCASAEGLHLTVWSDAPLGRRRFHAYHYLGYDVDPNCTEADVRP